VAGLPQQQKRPKKSRSLKMRAVDYLSRRDHSRFELERKLLSYSVHPDQDREEIAAILADLERQGFFDETRFANSLARRRGQRFGVARVQQELRVHKLQPDLLSSVVAELKVSEFDRALRVWQVKFGVAASEPKEKARQIRFLMGRGFSGAVISKIVKDAHLYADLDSID
jgi:regulatory protein